MLGPFIALFTHDHWDQENNKNVIVCPWPFFTDQHLLLPTPRLAEMNPALRGNVLACKKEGNPPPRACVNACLCVSMHMHTRYRPASSPGKRGPSSKSDTAQENGSVRTKDEVWDLSGF